MTPTGGPVARHPSNKKARQRDNISIATRSVLRPTITIKQLETMVANYAEPLNDRRRFQPTILTRPVTRSSTPARLDNRRLRSLYEYPFKIAVPDKVRVCERRKTRREVLHALKRTGKGARSKRRYSSESYYHC